MRDPVRFPANSATGIPPSSSAGTAPAGIVAGVGAGSDQASAPMVRAHSSCAPSFLSSIWNRARLAPLNKFAR